MTRRLAALGLALLLGACSRDEGAPVKPLAAGVDVALVQEQVLFGRTVPGGWVSGALRLRGGAEGAVLTQVAPSCGCTLSLTVMPLVLAPGAEADAPLAFDLSRLSDLGAPEGAAPRLIERSVAIASERGTRLTATVSVEVSHRVIVEPPQARFPAVPPGKRVETEFLVKGRPGQPPPEILAVDSPRPDLTTVIEAAAEGSLVRVAWTPSAPGALDDVLMLRLEGDGELPLSLRVMGEARPLVTVDPPSIENLAAPTSKPVIARVTLVRADGQPLEILGATCTSHRVEVDIEPGLGPVRTLRVLVPVMALPQEIQGTVLVRTSVEGAEALNIPVHVRAGG